jgi:signal transduction histidine kinase
MPKIKAFEYLSITAKIATSVFLLVALAVAVSLVDLYGLKSMQKAVDTAGQVSDVLVSVNTVTERVEHFIASYDKDSLLKAKAIMADTLDQLTGLAPTRPNEAISLTTGLKRFSEAIDTLGMSTDIMNTETSNMTTNHGRLQKVAMEIEQGIEERRNRLNKRTTIFDAQLRIIQDAYRILQIIHKGERKATAIVARGLADGKEADFTEADDTCKALPPVLDMLDGLIDATAWPEGLNRLKTSVTQAGQAVRELIDSPVSQLLTLGRQALQRLEIIHEMAGSLESIIRVKEESITRTTDDLRTDTGLLQNADNISKRFAERVSKLEAQTLSFRLSPTDEAAGLVSDILDRLTRFARILPSTGSPQGSASVLTVGDQIDGYRAAFDRFRQASKALRQAHEQVRQEAARTASLMTKFASEQRSVAADNRERAALIITLTSVIAVLIALFIAWHTSSLIARPIVALAEVMRRLAGGHLEDEIVGLERGDELGGMTRAVKVFQENAIRVRALEAEAEAERQRVLAQLENMVAERTRELQQANTMLREEIIKHTRAEEEIRRLNEELEQKVDERTRQIRRLNAELMEKITQLKEAQEELVRKEKLVILGQLSGSVGHELRNPLGVMSNAVYFLKMVLADVDEIVIEYLEIIQKEIDNSLRIISDLLDFARTKTPNIKTVTAHELLVESLGRCIIPENVELQNVVPQSFPPLKVDPLQIGQVLQNLITNAIQAMPTGGTLTIRGEQDREGMVQLEVADTGEGISPENMKNIFQPLFTTKAKGIGLGLVVCRNLTEANGGRIEVDSEPGRGTVFTVRLPASGGGT